ncbi:MAG: glycoside hydrolase family 28 protein, partial [Chitinophagales bacterium]
MQKILLFFLIIRVGLLTAQDYNILDYHAIADGTTMNTSAIQAAIDAAYNHGGGRVIIPSGNFLSGTIILKSNVELHLMENAVLLGSTNPDDYQKLNRWTAFVMADNAQHIAITGKGKIDGQGRALALHIDSLFYAGELDSNYYELNNKRPKVTVRPQLIEFVECTNVVVKNITLLNSASWLQTYERCNNVFIDSITVRTDAYWNNDGLDIDNCRNVRITNCDINSADDGICLKSQLPDLYCDSIYIANCRVRSSASAVKFGTVSHGGFKNVVIENIQVYDTYRSAIAIECVDGGTLENVFVNNIKATNTGNAIFIRLGERTKRGDGGTLRNILIQNMEVEIAFERPDYAYDIRGPELPFFYNPIPASITGIPGNNVEHVTLENITIHYPGRGNKGMVYL